MCDSLRRRPTICELEALVVTLKGEMKRVEDWQMLTESEIRSSWLLGQNKGLQEALKQLEELLDTTDQSRII